MGGAEPLDAEAEYQDGRQARPLWLRARLTQSSLELRRADGGAVASWPLAALRVVDRAGGVLRLAPEGSDARLLLSDARVEAAIEAAQRPLRRAALKRRLRAAAVAAVAVPAVALGVWKGWPPAADAIARAVPAEAERSVGAAVAAAVIGGKRVCDAPEGQAALDALLARLAAAGGVAAPVRVRVVDDPTVNALAAPGGEILLFRGLLDRAESADEVAGVLAHEIGHVEHRHGLRGVARAAGWFVLTGAISGGSDAVGLAAAFATLANSRDFEREADATGARTLAASGIGTEGLENFFERMERSRPSGRAWGYLSTHPAGGERAAALRAGGGQGARRAADAPPAMSAAEWAAARAICGAAKPAARRPTGQAAAAAAGRPSGAAAAAAAQRRKLGTFAAWEAWTSEEKEGPVCYALAYAAPAPGGKQDWKTRLWVAHRPWRSMDDISFVPDARPPDGAALWVELDGRRTELRMRGHYAAPRNSAALSGALRAAAAAGGAAEAVVGWSGPGDGTASETAARSWRFALGGLVEAHAAAGAACEAPP